MEPPSNIERGRSVRAASVAFFIGVMPASVPIWAVGADSRTKAAFLAAGLACWAVALLIWAGMGGVGRDRRERNDERLDFLNR